MLPTLSIKTSKFKDFASVKKKFTQHHFKITAYIKCSEGGLLPIFNVQAHGSSVLPGYKKSNLYTLVNTELEDPSSKQCSYLQIQKFKTS